jgi:hypothetical protein
MQEVLQNNMSVHPKDPNERNIIGVKSLYRDYMNVEIAELKALNRWYRRWAQSSKIFEVNLKLSQNLLVSHCSQGL